MTLKCWLCGRDFKDSEGLAPGGIFGWACWDCHKDQGPLGPTEQELASKRQRLSYRERQDQGFHRREDYEQDDPDRYPDGGTPDDLR